MFQGIEPANFIEDLFNLDGDLEQYRKFEGASLVLPSTALAFFAPSHMTSARRSPFSAFLRKVCFKATCSVPEGHVLRDDRL